MEINTLLATLMAAGLLPTAKQKPEPEPKTCLNCGKQHNHNNSFCSSDCCKNFNRGKR